MSTIMRKMNIISRCETIYRSQRLPELPGIYHSYVRPICKNSGFSQERLAKFRNQIDFTLGKIK